MQYVNWNPLVLIGGPGVGSTTVGKILVEMLETLLGIPADFKYTGAKIREMATTAGIPIEDFQKVITKAQDKLVDDWARECLRNREGSVWDSRLLGYVAITQNIPAFVVRLTCPLDERTRRIRKHRRQNKEGDRINESRSTNVWKIKVQIKKREAEENERFIERYGYDPYHPVHLTINTKGKTPEQVAQLIFAKYRDAMFSLNV